MNATRRLPKDLAQEIRDLILLLSVESEDMDNAGYPKINVYFSRQNLGGLLLSEDEANKYRKCLSNFIKTLQNDEKIGSRFIERLLQTAILKSIDIRGNQPETSIESRIDQAIEEMEGELSREPDKYKIFLQVNGISNDGLPIQIGGIKFSQFDQTELSVFKDRVTKNYSPQEMEDDLRYLLGMVVAEIDVQALDENAAKTIATNRLRIILDVINFFTDLVPYSLGFAYIPGEVERQQFMIPIQKNSDSFVFHYERSEPLDDFSLEKLIQTDNEKHIGFSSIEKMLGNSSNKLQKRIVASVQWAGRATVYSKRRKEEAFLLYVIALESIILADKNPTELSYRLKLRISHLLGHDSQSRLKIFQTINNLYAIRSGIVHNGQFQVTDADLSVARYLTKSCLIKILVEEPFCSMQSIEKFAQELEERILH